MKKPTFDKIITFLKVYLTFACCWPLPYNATKFQFLRNRLFRLFSALHAILLVVEIVYTIFNYTDDLKVKMILGFEGSIMLSIPVQIFLFTLYHDSLQVRDVIHYNKLNYLCS